MGREWRHEFVDGETRMACSICGSSRRFPSEITYCADKLFRCNDKCMERTTFEIDQTISAARRRRDEVDVSIGNPAAWETPQTLSSIAAERRAALIPGWTPTTTFHDAFDVLPGAGGSAWSIEVANGGTVASTGAGTATYAANAALGAAVAWNPSISVPRPATGKFYSILRFKCAGTFVNLSSIRTGAIVVAGGLPNTEKAVLAGMSASTSMTFFVSPWSLTGGPIIKTATEVDTAYHYGEVWWTGNGYAYGAIDLGLRGAVTPLSNFTGTINPYMGCVGVNGTESMTIDETVIYV